MPLPSNIKPQLNKFVSASVGIAQAMVITRVNKEVNRILEELLTQCPPPDELESLSKTINSLKPIVVQAEKKTQKAADIAKYLQPTITAAGLLVEVLINNPIPPTFITPPGPVLAGPTGPYGFLTTESIGQQARRNARVEWLKKLIETLSDEGVAIKGIVTAASNTLAPIKAKLDQIDALIQACMSNQDLSDDERKKLLDGIQGNQNDPSSNNIIYKSTSGYTYTIKVIVDPTSPQIAPKRQAIVQDFRGITVLTGPSSFASNPQVLVEEIKFRIENQLP